ncbi:MAG: thioredoxin family protein [Leptospirales bacterium]|nr:thioredoxin family protein [Leptospirales bacterium]
MNRFSLSAAAVLLTLCTTTSLHAEPVWIGRLDKGMAEAKHLGKPMFVDIMAPWCGYCRKMRQEVFPSKRFQEAANSFVLVRINAEEDISVRKFNVQGFPTLLMLDKNGYLVARIDGFAEVDRLVATMNDALRRSNTEDKLVREAREKPGVMTSYKAGLYYSSVEDQQKARTYFLAAWEAGRAGKDPRSLDSLYNAAVSSMELKDYGAAVKLWSDYLQNYPGRDSDFAYARYFRALSLRSMGQNAQAKDDLAYAATHLPEGEDKQSARRMARVN